MGVDAAVRSIGWREGGGRGVAAAAGVAGVGGGEGEGEEVRGKA